MEENQTPTTPTKKIHRLQKGHRLTNVPFPTTVLIKRLHDGEFRDNIWVEMLQEVARLLDDPQIWRKETREKLLPLANRAILKDFVHDQSFKAVWTLLKIWDPKRYLPQSNPQSVFEPAPVTVAPKVEKPWAAAKKEADAKEQERHVKKLYGSALMDQQSMDDYWTARKTGKTILFQIPSGQVIFDDQTKCLQSTVDVATQSGTAVVIAVKSPRTKRDSLVEIDNNLLWRAPEPNPEQALLESRDTMYPKDKPRPRTGPVDSDSTQAFMQSFMQRYYESRKISFTPTGTDDAGETVGTLIITASNCSMRGSDFPEHEFTTWESSGFDNDSIPEIMLSWYVQNLKTEIAYALQLKNTIGANLAKPDRFDSESLAIAQVWGKPAHMSQRPQQPNSGDIAHFISMLDAEPKHVPDAYRENNIIDSKRVNDVRRAERVAHGLRPGGGAPYVRQNSGKHSISELGQPGLYADAQRSPDDWSL